MEALTPSILGILCPLVNRKN